MLRISPIKAYLLVPLLSVCSAFLLPLFLFWKPTYQASLMYTKVVTLSEATHLLVNGHNKNVEIV